jgi:hypothetical protein
MAAPNPISHGDLIPGFFVSGLFSFFSSDFAFFSSGLFVCGLLTCDAFISGFKSSADPETGTQARTSAAAHAIFFMTFHPPGAGAARGTKLIAIATWPIGRALTSSGA